MPVRLRLTRRAPLDGKAPRDAGPGAQAQNCALNMPPPIAGVNAVVGVETSEGPMVVSLAGLEAGKRPMGTAMRHRLHEALARAAVQQETIG